MTIRRVGRSSFPERAEEIARRLADLRAGHPGIAADVEYAADCARQALISSAVAHERSAQANDRAVLRNIGDTTAHQTAADAQRVARDADYRAAGLIT